MNTNATSLDRLHDIVMPAPVPWWPPAPGWYWVLAFAVLLTLGFVVKGFIRWQCGCYRREALAQLACQKTALNNPAQRAAALAALAGLLKQAALTAFPREQVARLTGPEWFAFLDRTGNTWVFSGGLGAMLEQAAYDPRTATRLDEVKAGELVSNIGHWLRRHRAHPIGRSH